jgi:hypothetical protein
MVGIAILWCRSAKTGRRFPLAQFSADVDYATEGMVSLTSIEKPEVVIAELTGEEMLMGNAGAGACEVRVNRRLGRTDLRIPSLLRVVGRDDLYFSDILSGEGEARVVRKVSRAKFKKEGGSVLMLENPTAAR